VKYARQQFLKMVVVTIAVTMLTFLLLSLLPGDRVTAIGGPGLSEAERAVIIDKWGLDDPLPVQYGRWLWNTVRGDLGISSSFNVPVSTLISDRLPRSLALMLYAQVLALLIAIPLGVVAAHRANTPTDRIVNTGAFGVLAIPNYILGVLLTFLFATNVWRILPRSAEWVPLFPNPFSHLRVVLLPTVTLALPLIATYMRLLRADMVATLQNDFIAMARAKGMPTGHILFRHALRPSLFSIMTAASVNVGALIGGAVVVERIFGLGGMGGLLVEAILRRDFLVVQTAVVILAFVFVLSNFLVDLLYGVIDPRIRHARALA
jgi:peptide/nickel transport system permease protein